jgi:hypothetical protein
MRPLMLIIDMKHWRARLYLSQKRPKDLPQSPSRLLAILQKIKSKRHFATLSPTNRSMFAPNEYAEPSYHQRLNSKPISNARLWRTQSSHCKCRSACQLVNRSLNVTLLPANLRDFQNAKLFQAENNLDGYSKNCGCDALIQY